MPPNSTPLEFALADAAADAVDIQVPLRDLWNPDTCPESHIAYLAWAFSVDQWDKSWPIELKREVVRQSLKIHRIKGSRASVEQALAALGFPGAVILEGVGGNRYNAEFTYDGTITYGVPSHWAEYRVFIKQPISNRQAAIIRDALATVAPARSHLVELDFTEAVALYDATITYDGAFNYGVA